MQEHPLWNWQPHLGRVARVGHTFEIILECPEVVEEATEMAPDAQGWCTVLEEDPEEPHRSRKTMEP